MQNKILIKRTIIVAILIVVISLIGLVLYLTFSAPATCTDNKQNEGEKGVDCGGPCAPCKVTKAQDLIVKETAFVTGGGDTYDVLAKLSNPNDSLGAQTFNYTFTLKDASGAVIATKDGSDFILPADTKYVTQLGIETQGNAVPASVEISFSNPVWVPLGDVEKPQLGVYDKQLGKAPTGDGSEVNGLLRNESNYDLNKVTMVIVLRDADNKVVAIDTTEKNAVRVGQQLDFRLDWPYALPGVAQSIEVDAQSNVLDPQNFSTVR